MKSNYVLLFFLATGITTNTFAGKPPPKPAADLVCDGCVETIDINDAAVTEEKLSTELQQQINEFEARIAALENPPPPPPREFIDNGDSTITDTGTGLMWEMKDARDSVEDYTNPHDTDNWYTWTSLDDGDDLNPDGTAFTDFLASLNNVATPLAGYTDWRLPTLEELQTILYEPEPCISPFGLNACVVDPLFWPSSNQYYWTSTAWVIDPTYASVIFFGSGHIAARIKYGISPVRAVRKVK